MVQSDRAGKNTIAAATVVREITTARVGGDGDGVGDRDAAAQANATVQTGNTVRRPRTCLMTFVNGNLEWVARWSLLSTQ
jgi:hypothetical protein